MVMRKYSIGATPSNPSVIAMAEQGIDLQMLDEACREARESKPGETISVGYIVKKLEGWKRQAALVNVKGALKRSNGASAWWLSNESMSAKATELGIAGARGGESSEAFKARIQAAINGRSAA